MRAATTLLLLLFVAAPLHAQVVTRDCVTNLCSLITDPVAPGGVTCRFFNAGALIAETPLASSACSLPFRYYPAGTYALTARVVDSYGQESGDSNVLTLISVLMPPPPLPPPNNLRVL